MINTWFSAKKYTPNNPQKPLHSENHGRGTRAHCSISSRTQHICNCSQARADGWWSYRRIHWLIGAVSDFACVIGFFGLDFWFSEHFGDDLQWCSAVLLEMQNWLFVWRRSELCSFRLWVAAGDLGMDRWEDELHHCRVESHLWSQVSSCHSCFTFLYWLSSGYVYKMKCIYSFISYHFSMLILKVNTHYIPRIFPGLSSVQ